ncbi:molybdenum cofactor biosynthesis protein MoaE [Cellulomonas bogoriensis]|uniref:Molybdenum cofactor biosynthesis protein MoaE n=1 Tax=Cellulomonas bogoriensis 69B4 = DSM 16987 TaxID=1386082 RepID=A0A0A0C1H6_9CELL|nr:molybdenum cofactor biosynthesis protein MoaE [Cellulomonas bogoriensis]KGM14066.1 molybdenum cofactor biosynthesis protein MoaE [Cellulomonas bogoriensis 69B4 = DSM 16987]
MIARLTTDPLDPAEHLAAVAHPAAGAVATFLGQVRDHDPAVEGQVSALEYSAHPDARTMLHDVANRHAQVEGVLGVAISHRTGHLPVGDVAVVAAVATAHRALAFEVCARLVEDVKAEVPIWKKEILTTGEHVWVGL